MSKQTYSVSFNVCCVSTSSVFEGNVTIIPPQWIYGQIDVCIISVTLKKNVAIANDLTQRKHIN